jgi:hypothetical protein
MKRALLILATALTFFIVVAIAIHGQKPPRITGTYSNMYFNEEGGDVSGEGSRLFLPVRAIREHCNLRRVCPATLSSLM